MVTTNKIVVQLPKLHEYQQRVKADKTRFRVLVAGRRWGKTEMIIDELATRMLNGQSVGYLSLTNKSMGETFEKMEHALSSVIAPHGINRRDMTIKLITGGRVTFWSIESAKRAIRGRGYSLFVIDEAAFIPNLSGRFNEAILPLLADRRGHVLMASTTNGFNDFYQFYMMGIDSSRGNWSVHVYPTSTSPFIHPDELLEQKAIMPERAFRQEYMAEFLDDGGAVFRGVGAVATLARPEPYAGKFVMGVDWGKMNDYTVISVIDADNRREVALARFNQIGWALQRGRLRELFDIWQPYMILAEANSIGEPNIEALQSEGLPVQGFMTTAVSKAPLIEALSLSIEKSEIGLLSSDDKEAALANAELQAYTIHALPGGGMRYGAPNGMHDDTVIARALAWRACMMRPSVMELQRENPFIRRR